MQATTKTKLDLIAEKSFANKSFCVSETAEINAIKNLAEREKRESHLDGQPLKVRLELTNKCNLNCVFCYRAHFRTDDHSLLKPEDIDELDPVLRTAKHISLSQKAESLMSPYIVPILDKMAAYDAVFYMSTNALKLTDDISHALIRNKITFLTISASVFDQEYGKIYRGGKFDELEKNILRLNQLKKAAGSDLPRLRLSFVLRKDTLPHLDDALSFVKKHSFSEGIQILSYFSYTEEDQHLEPALNWQEYEEEIARVRSKAERENILFEFSLDVLDGMRASACTDYASQCYEPWESINVSPDGSIYPCPQAPEPMGNIRNDSVSKVWNNDRFQQFRKAMNGPPYNNACAECWHCRYVSAMVTGKKLSKLDRVYDTYYRRARPVKTAVDVTKILAIDGAQDLMET